MAKFGLGFARKSIKINERPTRKRKRPPKYDNSDESEAEPAYRANIAHWKKHAMGPFRNPFDVDDDDFVDHFGVDKFFALKLIEDLKGHLPDILSTKAIPNEIKVLATLRFLFTGLCQKGAGENCLISLSQSSVYRSVSHVTQAINEGLFEKWVKFPQTDEERQRISLKFEDLNCVPNILGSLNCWCPPVTDPKVPLTIKKIFEDYPSKAVQVVSDGNLRILNICIGECKGFDPNGIWRESDIREVMKKRHADGFTDEWIVVSGGEELYETEPWLICPQLYGNLGLDLGRAKTAGFECMDALKAEFGCLKSNKLLSYCPKMMFYIVNSCAALHNMLLDNRLNGKRP